MSTPLFLHGRESNAHGRKATWLRERYDAVAPDLDTSRLETAIDQARTAITAHRPSVVIGSSFGGAVLLELVCSGFWTGPCIFLAQAGVKLTPRRALPDGTRAILIHGLRDDVVPIDDSRLLARTGGADVQLIEVDDDHRLGSVLGPVLEQAIAAVLAFPG